MLDNSNMTIDLSGYPDIRLSFVVFGSVDNKFWEVVFTINQTLNLKMEADDDARNNDLFFVVEVSVNSKKISETEGLDIRNLKPDDNVWFIYIYGDVITEIACCDFKWILNELSHEEYNARYKELER